MTTSKRVVAVFALSFLLLPVFGASAETEYAIGYGGYAVTDLEPVNAATFTISPSKVLIGLSLAFRLGESTENTTIAAKCFYKMKNEGDTMIGLGGSFTMLTDEFGTENAYGLGLGGGVEQRIGTHVAVSADLYPLSFRFGNSVTRFGILSSGALGVSYYF